MGFADLSIAEIAADYQLPVEEVLALCKQLGISYKDSQTRLALEDAKAVISQILSQEHSLGNDGTEGVRS
jgi:ATP-dependent RNA circularization protein (DNA/RNA ligase family)